MVDAHEELCRNLSTNRFVSSNNIIAVARSITERHRRLLRQTGDDIDTSVLVQDLMRLFSLESHGIEISLSTIETFLERATLTDWNSTVVNARLNEIQVVTAKTVFRFTSYLVELIACMSFLFLILVHFRITVPEWIDQKIVQMHHFEVLCQR